jgi:threonine synthase
MRVATVNSMVNGAVKCSRCGWTVQGDERVLTTCEKCGGALLFRIDLDEMGRRVSREALGARKDTFWKFGDFLPLSSRANIVSLGEPYTPLLRIHTRRDKLYEKVFLKDEGRLPTGTFKARGMAVAVSLLKELGVGHVAIPSAGNAASALAAYGARAGMKVSTFMPKDTPKGIVTECICMGADVFFVDGSISDAAKALKTQKRDWVDVSTNRQPYRFEGYKIAAFEVAEQFNWDLPDQILLPTGGGEGVIGFWKGFNELASLGWIDKVPRLSIVQSSGCSPLVEAYKKGQSEVIEAWRDPATIASGLRVPFPFASYLVLRAVKETKGLAIAVDDAAIISSIKALYRMGVFACPEAASTFAALKLMHSENPPASDERTLLYFTGTAMKYPDAVQIDKTRIQTLTTK